ncbi:MAG: hypothetical protein HYY07_01230 [Elusimicrobia bacterium]|nr:hypothetical protein [Elusimicrobiota bacterium]
MKKNNPKSAGEQNRSLKKFLTGIEWAGCLWAYWVLYKYLQLYPISSQVFGSLLPIQTYFPDLFALAWYLKGIVLWFSMTATSFTIGWCVLRWVRVNWQSSLEKALFSTILGEGFLALLTLGLAFLHLLSPIVLGSVCFLGALLFFFLLFKFSEVRSLIQESCRQAFSFIFGKESPLILRIFLWAYLGMSFMMAFVPDLFYDALVYHLGAPNLYLQERGLVRTHGVLSKVPMIWQILYPYGLALHDEMVPKLIHWSSSLFLLLGFGSLSQRFSSSPMGVVSGLLFLSIPMVQMNLWTSGIDVGGALFAYLAVYAALVTLNLKETPESPPEEKDSARGWIFLAAIFSGFSFGSKYQGGFTSAIVFIILFLVPLYHEPKRFRSLLPDIFIFNCVLFIVIAPWLLKNLYDTGNPLFPFLSPLFTKLNLQKMQMDPYQWVGFINENRRYIAHTWGEIWKLPWTLAFKDSNQSSLSFTGAGPLSFLLLSLLWIPNLKKWWAQGLFLYLVLFFAASFQSTHLTRYHLQGYPMLCFFLGLGFHQAWSKNRAIFRILLTIPFLFILLGNLQTSLFVIQNSYLPWDVLSGRESRESYRLYTHPGLNPYPSNVLYRWMEKNLGRETRTLLIGESKSFDLHLPYVYTDVHGQNPLITWTEISQTPDEIHQKFYQAGVTHLLINIDETRRTYGYKMLKWDELTLKRFDLFWNKYVREVHREKIPERYFAAGNPILLYRISASESEAASVPIPPNPLLILEQMTKRTP